MTDQSLLPGVVLGWWLTFAVHSVVLLLVTAIVQWGVRGIRPLWRDAIWKLALVMPLFSATLLAAGGVHPIWQWDASLGLPDQAAGESDKPHVDSSFSMAFVPAATEAATSRAGLADSTQSAAATGAAESVAMDSADRIVTRVLEPIELANRERRGATRQQHATPVVVDSSRSAVAGSDWPTAASQRVDTGQASDDLPRAPSDRSSDLPEMGVIPWSRFAILSLLVCWSWSLMRCGIARLRLRRLIRAARADGKLDLVLIDVRQRLGYRGRVRLLVSERVSEPMACGVCRPAVLLPTSLLRQLDREQLQEVLAHELSHLTRRDLVWLGLFRFVGQLVPGHLPARWAARRWRENAELLCDDWVLHHGFSRTVLASALVVVSEWKLSRLIPAPVGCVTFASRSSAVSRRVMRLLEESQPNAAKWTRWQRMCWLVVVASGPLIAGRCLPAASWSRPERVQLDRAQVEWGNQGTVESGSREDQGLDRNAGRESDSRSFALIDQELRELQSELEVVESLLVQLGDPSVLQLAGNLENRAKQLRGRLEQLKSSRQLGRSHGDNLAHVRADSRGDE